MRKKRLSFIFHFSPSPLRRLSLSEEEAVSLSLLSSSRDGHTQPHGNDVCHAPVRQLRPARPSQGWSGGGAEEQGSDGIIISDGDEQCIVDDALAASALRLAPRAPWHRSLLLRGHVRASHGLRPGVQLQGEEKRGERMLFLFCVFLA